MFLYRLVDLWRCLWQMTRKSITWPWSGCRLSLRRNLSPDQALVLYTHKNDVDWSRGSSCILFDMLSLHSSTAWKLNKIPWFFWGKKSLSKTKAINRIYPLTCRIILCLKLKKKTCIRKTLKYYLPRCWISVSFFSNLMTNCYKLFFLSNIRTNSINISSFYPRLILFYWKHFNFFEKEMLSCDILTPVLTFDFCTCSEIGWHLLEF